MLTKEYLQKEIAKLEQAKLNAIANVNAIEGALMDVHWNDIPTERKEALNRQLEVLSVRNKN